MKFKYIKQIGLALIASGSLISCDSGELKADNDPANFPDEITVAFETMRNNDRITFTSVSSPEPLVSFLIFGSETSASSFGTPNFLYNKISKYRFELESDFDAPKNLTEALDATLNNPSPQGTRLRQILNKVGTDFTNAELLEIVAILNPVGAEISVNPNNPLQLVSASNRTYTQEITSLNRDLITGVQSGNYEITDTPFIINFRTPTRDDLADYRLITSQTKIPTLSNTLVNPSIIENGRWVMILANQ